MGTRHARRRADRLRSEPRFSAEPLESRTLLSTISGVAWNDLNANGARDGGEPPLSGWTLYLDADNDGSPDAGETTTTTDASGAYTFPDRPAGTYYVRQVVPPGTAQTYPTATSWIAAGPTAIHGGQVEGMPAQKNPVAGAIHAVATHPTNPDILYIGAVNGGVWKSTNATSADTTWVPLTDEMGSLSIGALEFDPTDPTANTLVAGVGRFSSLAFDGGPRTGAIRTTDGGSSWTQLDAALAGKNISGVAARGNTVVVSVNIADEFYYGNIGIWRSTNGGAAFTRVSGDAPASAPNGLPGGRAFDLAGDPSNPAILYVAIRDAGTLNGIYKSTNTGATWTRVSSAAMNALNTDAGTSNATNIEIAIGNAGQVFVGIMGSNGRLSGLFRSPDGGTTWNQLETPVTNENGTLIGLQPREKEFDLAGGQGQWHFSIAADPTNANIVYLGGDRQPGPGDGASWPNSIGAANYTGRLFRVDASLPAGSQATALTHNPSTTNNSAPHADSRDMMFDAAGNLVEGDDGGVYQRTNPRTTGVWTSLNGNLQVTEIHSLDYDHNANIISAGTQDVGSIRSRPSGTTWDTSLQGDGGVTHIDDSAATFSYHYRNYIRLDYFFRDTVNPSGAITARTPVGLVVNGTGGQTFAQYDTTRQFYNPYVLNTVAPARMAIGTSRVYLSLDRGDTLTDLGAVGGSVSALAYGGRQGGIDNPDVLYVCAGAAIYFRGSSGAPLAARTSYPGGTVKDIVLDPQDWATAYVTDGAGVYSTSDAGVSWTNLTGSLALSGLRTIEYVAAGAASSLMVGGLGGVFASVLGSVGTWMQFGHTLPDAPVTDLRYDATDDILVAGTLGRGAWTFPHASLTLNGTASNAHVVVLSGQNVTGIDFGSQIYDHPPVIGALSDSPDPVAFHGIVTLSTTADDDVSVAGVSFYFENNGLPGLQVGSGGDWWLSDDNSSPYSVGVDTINLTAGTYTYYAFATDGLGLTSPIATTTNTIQPNQPPTIDSFNATPAEVPWDESFTLNATASDPDGSVASVAFYIELNGIPGLQPGGDIEIGLGDADAPYGVFIAGDMFSPRTYAVYAVATDNWGALSEVATTTLIITPNIRPVIHSFTASPDPVAPGGLVTLSVSTTDADDMFILVFFYREASDRPGDKDYLGEDSTFPYSIDVDTAGLAPGTYTYYARAYDLNDPSGFATTTNTINGAPAGVGVTPGAASDLEGTFRTFAAQYRDANGAADVDLAYLRVLNTATGKVLTALYYGPTDKMYLLSETGALLGGFAPGSAHTISNTLGTLDVANTTLTRSGDTLTVNWSISAKAPLVGANSIQLLARDRAIAWSPLTTHGSWTVTNVNLTPVNGGITPSAASDNAGVFRTFTAQYSDANGSIDIDIAYLRVLNTSTGAVFMALYYRPTGRLHLVAENGSTLLAGFTPGSANFISNSLGTIDVANTTVTDSGNTLTINWAVSASAALAGSNSTQLLARDRALAWSPLTTYGSWSVSDPANVAPTNVGLTPSPASDPAGTFRTFTAQYADTKGASDIDIAYLRVANPSTGKVLTALYYAPTNRMYLLAENGSTLLGGFTPGSANTITNTLGTLDVAGTSVSRSGNTLTVNWSIAAKATMAGTNNLQLLARDRSFAWSLLTTHGSWTIL